MSENLPCTPIALTPQVSIILHNSKVSSIVGKQRILHVTGLERLFTNVVRIFKTKQN